MFSAASRRKAIFLNPSSRCGKSCLNLKEFRPSADEYRRICDPRTEIVRPRSVTQSFVGILRNRGIAVHRNATTTERPRNGLRETERQRGNSGERSPAGPG